MAQLPSDAVALLDANTIASAHVIGYSTGGMIAQEFRNLEGMRGQAAAIRGTIPSRLPTIVATLIVVGDADAIIDWRNSPLMAVHIEGAQLHVLSGLRHGPAMERPDLVNSLLLDFLAHRRAS